MFMSAPESPSAFIISLSACVDEMLSPSTAIFPAMAPAASKNAPPLQSPSTVSLHAVKDDGCLNVNALY